MWNLSVLQRLGSDEIAALYAFVKKLSLDASRYRKGKERGREGVTIPFAARWLFDNGSRFIGHIVERLLHDMIHWFCALKGLLYPVQEKRVAIDASLIITSQHPYNTGKCVSFQGLFASRSICPISWRAGGCWAVDSASCGLWWTTCCARLPSSISF